MTLDINDPRVVHLSPMQEESLAHKLTIVAQHITDDGMPSVGALAAFFLGNRREENLAGMLSAVHAKRLSAWAKATLSFGIPTELDSIRTTQQMGVTDVDGALEHLKHLVEEDPTVIYHAPPRALTEAGVKYPNVQHSPAPWTRNLNEIYDANGVLVAIAEWGGPKKGERPTAANAQRIIDCVNAAEARRPAPTSKLTENLVTRLLTESIAQVGGHTAWNRLSPDAKLDVVRSRAWLVVQGRADESVMCYVADLNVAMAQIYGMDL